MKCRSYAIFRNFFQNKRNVEKWMRYQNHVYFSTKTSYTQSNQTNTTDFGYKEVNIDEKERMVREVFSKVATRYDIMNDLMSAGIHRLWKDKLISMLNIPITAKIDSTMIPRHLDVAGGTGDIAFRSIKEIIRCYPSTTLSTLSSTNGMEIEDGCRQVVVCDINPDMLSVGKMRTSDAIGVNHAHMVGFVEGNAEKLPFDDNSFDIYTIAFGLRNVTNKDTALREAYRVLKKGGRLLVLEFSHLIHPGLQYLYDQYSFTVIPQLGQVVANDRDSYQYLIESIRKFPKQEELKNMISSVGFRSCSYVNLTFGVVAIHSGYKL